MHVMLSNNHTVYKTEAQAADVAAKLQADEDMGWTYKVIPDPNGSGKAIIKVYDEDGIFMANFGC